MLHFDIEHCVIRPACYSGLFFGRIQNERLRKTGGVTLLHCDRCSTDFLQTSSLMMPVEHYTSTHIAEDVPKPKT